MLIDAGPRDQRAVQGLKDYGLIYRGEALPEDLMIAGEVRVTHSVQSDCPDTDFVARRTSATRNRWFARLTAGGKGIRTFRSRQVSHGFEPAFDRNAQPASARCRNRRKIARRLRPSLRFGAETDSGLGRKRIRAIRPLLPIDLSVRLVGRPASWEFGRIQRAVGFTAPRHD